MEQNVLSAELRRRALNQLKGHWGTAILVTVILILITYLVSLIPFIGPIVNFLIAGPLMLGFAVYFIRLTRSQSPGVSQAFDGFSRFWSAFLVYLLTSIFVFLWSLLLIIPGIIASYRYAMAYYILNDYEGISALEAIRRSKELMVGHKWRYFKLQFSFIGWFILSLIPAGIGLIWFIPYASAASAEFYEDLTRSATTQA